MLKFGDPASLAQRDKARIRAATAELYSDRMLNKLLTELDEMEEFCRTENIGMHDQQRRDVILKWLEECAEKRGAK